MPRPTLAALWFAGAAVAVGLAAWAARVGGDVTSVLDPIGVVVHIAIWFVAPVLTLVAVVSVGVGGELLSAGRAALVAALGTVAYGAACAAAFGYAWAAEAAASGGPEPALAAATVPLALAGWPFGGAAVALALDGIGRERMPRRAPRLAAAVLAGLVLAPLLGLGGATPFFTVLPPLVVLLVAALPYAQHAPPEPRRDPRRLLWLAGVFAWVALVVGGIGGVVTATAGVRVLGAQFGNGAQTGGADASADQLALGLALGGAAAITLLAAIAIIAAPRAPRPVWTLWVPVAALAMGALMPVIRLLVPASADALADSASIVSWAIAAGSFAWGRLPISGPPRVVVAGVASVTGGLAALIAAGLVPLIVPIGALVTLLALRLIDRRERGDRVDQPSDDSNRPPISSTSK